MVLSTITFGQLFLLMFLFIPVTIGWVWSIFDNFGRPDHGGWAKAIWFIALIALPIVGTLIYVIARPADYEMVERQARYAA